MIMYNQNIVLDLNTNISCIVVGAKQGDYNSRTITATITKNGQPFNFPVGATALYRIRKPNGEAIWNDATINPSVHQVIISLTYDDLSVAGRCYADIVIDATNTRISTISFVIDVQASPDVEAPSGGGGGGSTPIYPSLPEEYQELEYLTTNETLGYPRINTDSFSLQEADAVTFIFRGEGVMIGKRNYGWNVNAGTTTQLTNLYNCTKLFISWEQITQEAGDFASICVTGVTGAFDYGQWGTDYHYTGDLGILTVSRGTVVNGGTYDTIEYKYVVVMALIPCYRKSDDVNGFYDSVNDVFYTAITGTFARGPEKE